MSNLPALVHLQNDLLNLKRECAKGYIDSFVNLLIEDLKGHYNSVSTRETLNRLYTKKEISQGSIPQIQQIQLISISPTLQRIHYAGLSKTWLKQGL